ncbi:ABATE domain-containing protein [Massilia sp. METH4]|uniref:CGNR zinc finger domain-containing protein n=1 Tax=Massilia sp. METH4 TaxID=3123041 RepID=UPI0030D3C92D
MEDTALLGDHPALDLLNTVVRTDGELVDRWRSDADVLHWLAGAGAGVLPEPFGGPAPAGLLDMARALREVVRQLVMDRKAGKRPDVRALNAVLAEGPRHLELAWQDDGALTLAERYTGDLPRRLLAPLAERAAELIATGDFALVRKCEDEQCVLWFLDRTKSHRRRWCSMALCGNRNKVASFRQRRQQDG